MFGPKDIKIVASESSKYKPPIWRYFTISEKDKSKAICNSCGGTLSLGSEKPKFQTTGNIKNHLKSKHQNQFLEFNKITEDSK